MTPTSTFFICEMKFEGIGEKVLQTKAAPIASLNLSISHWSLSKEEIRRSFITTNIREPANHLPGHTTMAPPLGFELAANGIQFHAIANLDKTSLGPE